MSVDSVSVDKLAGIQYHGLVGVTRGCLRAMARLIQFGDRIEKAYLITSLDQDNGVAEHCYLLFLDYDGCVAIKSGFSSGYGGEGPAGLSMSLQMLVRHNVDIEEYDVSHEIIDRIDRACLLSSDLDSLRSLRPVMPSRVYDYIGATTDHFGYDNRRVQQVFPDIIPYSVLDTRIIDLAIGFGDDPDSALMTGFRRLEDTIRSRSELEGVSGAKLFSQVFLGNEPRLCWPSISHAESQGRAQLFTGTYMAFRNSRAHQEIATTLNDAVKEFLLINQLFVLESEAVKV